MFINAPSKHFNGVAPYRMGKRHAVCEEGVGHRMEGEEKKEEDGGGGGGGGGGGRLKSVRA